uniref:Uncharacterized protein n=1 Tax=Anguilla anguilla TaxID=7936 RepID=A0A0E9QKM2_ANGAN
MNFKLCLTVPMFAQSYNRLLPSYPSIRNNNENTDDRRIYI